MGLLQNLNNILSFQESYLLQPFLKKLAIRQFLNTLKRYKKLSKPQDTKEIKWGQEIQGNFLFLNQQNQLCLDTNPLQSKAHKFGIQMVDQFGSFMFEINAIKPYNTFQNFDQIIRQIKTKYILLQSNNQIIALTIPNISFLGTKFTKSTKIHNPQSEQLKVFQSRYLEDIFVSFHPRYQNLNRNICKRRNHPISFKIPIFEDQNTSFTKIKSQLDEPFEGYIHMDSICFGLGVSSLQCTFSTKNLDHARYIHDQLNILSPIFLALTAGTPFHKGQISQWDVRWPVAEGIVDDRTLQQKNPYSQSYIPDSRYSSANYYIWNGSFNLQQYNDYNLGIKQCQKQAIRQQSSQLGIEIDDMLLKYLSYLMRRDLLIVKEEYKSMSDQRSQVFDMLNGTIWNSVRLKTPIHQSVGWRVQFRTMDVQLTPDQNAAYILIIHFIIRILHQNYDLNLYLPASKLRQNFKRAFKNNSLLNQKFYFRTNIFDKEEPFIQQLTVHQIFFGYNSLQHKQNQFKGLYHIIIEQMQKIIKVNQNERCKKLIKIIEIFLKKKTSGQLLTLAQWMRDYVSKSVKYKKDSLLSKQLMDEMLLTLYDISKGIKKDKNFPAIFEQNF